MFTFSVEKNKIDILLFLGLPCTQTLAELF